MNKNKLIATYDFGGGGCELLNFEEFKTLLMDLMYYEIKKFKVNDEEDEVILNSLKKWRSEITNIHNFKELLSKYKDKYNGIDMFNYISLNTSEIYDFNFDVEFDVVLRRKMMDEG